MCNGKKCYSSLRQIIGIIIILLIIYLYFGDIFIFITHSNDYYEYLPFLQKEENVTTDINSTIYDKIKKSISLFAWKYSECSLKSPFSNKTAISQNIYDKLYNTIYSNQFKSDPSVQCNISEYWVHDLRWRSGLGFILKSLAVELFIAVSRNKTFIYGNNVNEWPFYNENNKYLGMDYYFKPITNCKLPPNTTENPYFYNDYIATVGRVIDYDSKKFWSHIIPRIFNANWSWDQYNSLTVVAEWFVIMRYNINTQRIIANNIKYAFLNHLQFEHFIEFMNKRNVLNVLNVLNTSNYSEYLAEYIMNKMIATPIRYSDKCYHDEFNDNRREMVCFDDKHYIKIIKLIQYLYGDGIKDISYSIVTSEDSSIINKLLNNKNKTFNIIINDNDIQPNTGDPDIWWKINSTLNNDKNDKNDLMISMLTTLQLNMLTKYIGLIHLNSNWHVILYLFRNHLKCGYTDYSNINNQIKINLKSYCSRCGTKGMDHTERIAVFPNINKQLILNNIYIQSLVNKTCPKWNLLGASLECWITL